jgi:hypothetical protein
MHTRYVDLARTAACYREDAQDEAAPGLLARAPYAAAWLLVLLVVWGVI